MDYDGIVELIVPDIKCLQEAFSDAYYQEKVKPDEALFIDGENSHAMYGIEEMYISNGQPLVRD